MLGQCVGLVFGTALRYVRAHGRLVEPDGMPSLIQREQDLLQRYRQFYLDLVEGRRLPETGWRRMIRDRNVRAIMRRMGPDEPSNRQTMAGRPDARHRG